MSFTLSASSRSERNFSSGQISSPDFQKFIGSDRDRAISGCAYNARVCTESVVSELALVAFFRVVVMGTVESVWDKSRSHEAISDGQVDIRVLISLSVS